MKKKVIAILLSLCMAVSGFNTVFAADDDGIILGEITEPEDEDSGEKSYFDKSNMSVFGQVNQLNDLSYIVPDGYEELSHTDTYANYMNYTTRTSFNVVDADVTIDYKTLGDNYTYALLRTPFSVYEKQDNYMLMDEKQSVFEDKPALIRTFLAEDYIYLGISLIANDKMSFVYFMLEQGTDISKEEYRDFSNIFYTFRSETESVVPVEVSDTEVYDEGTYIVGEDFEPGRYRLIGTGEEPYFSVTASRESLESTAEGRLDISDGETNDPPEKDIQLEDGQMIVLLHCKMAKEK